MESNTSRNETSRSRGTYGFRRWLGGLVLVSLVALGLWVVATPPDSASASPEPASKPAPDPAPDPAHASAPASPSQESIDGEPSMSDTTTWADVDRLISEQKYQAALDAVARLRGQAEAASDDDELLRALVRETQLTTALHGYERSVRFLRDAAESGLWPDDPEAVLIHRLFFAHSLHIYQQAYSWQIRQRERTTSPDADLDQWTVDQIAAEIHASFFEAWSLRQDWGERSLGDLSRFLEQNTYPARIRGTLRDSISHLWVGLLENRSLWTPQQSNEIWKLDPQELLAEASAGGEEVEARDARDAALRDPDVHPLRKIHIVLADLEDWHRRNGRPEAAFDARRTLISKLSRSFSDPGEQELLRRDLEASLGRLGRDYPWWSMGQADLAEMTASSDAPWAIRDGRDLAESGRLAHPKSAGGQRCMGLVERWELPRVSISAMTHDGVGRRSVQVRHANVDTLYWRALPWDVESKLRSSQDRLDIRHQDIERLLARKPLAAWQTDLPPTPDLRDHQTYVTPPLEDHGAYVLVADSDPDFRVDARSTGDVIYYVAHRVTDLALFTRQMNGTLHAEVRTADHGAPLEGIDVEAWRLDWKSGHRVVASGRTDAGGELSMRVPQNGQYQVVARRGDDSVHQHTWLGQYQPEGESTRVSTLHYTDRAIYRPGQDLHWKVVGYQHSDQFTRAEVLKDHEITVQLYDANGEEVASQEVKTNEWGSASGTFQIPTGRALGSWRLSSFGNSTNIRVEEYKRPTFEVAMQKPDESLRFGRPTELTGEARYYFGAPVTDGRVEWRVTRTPILPHWWYWRMSWWNPSPPQVLASGETEVEADGTFRFEFRPEADPSLAKSKLGRQVAYAFRIEADVVDPGGETRSGETTLRAGFITVQASVSGSQMLREGTEVAFDVSRTNLEGKVSPGEGRWEFVRLEPPAEPVLPSEVPVVLEDRSESSDDEEPYRTEGDRLHTRWSGGATDVQSVLRRWDEGELVAADALIHEDEAAVPVALPGLVPGAYLFRYVTEDEAAADSATDVSSRVEAEQRFVVLPRDSNRDGTPPLPLLLHPQSSSVEVGDVAEVVVHTGWTDQDVMLEIWSGDERLRREILAGGELHRIELPVDESHRGSLLFDASLVRDHQQIRQQTTVTVPWTDKKLKVELSSFRDLLRPGAAETWTVTVRDPDGEPLGARAAEVLASMYDRSLDHFATLYPPSPETSWRSWTRAPAWATSVGTASGARQIGRQPRPRTRAPGFRDDRLILFDGYPVGGPGRRRMAMMSMTTMAKREPVPAPASPPMAEDRAEETITVTAESPVLDVRKTVVGSTAEYVEQEPILEEDAVPSASEPPPTEGLRTDFSETAFWEPHLLLTDDGTASFEFEVPDAVTEWRVWLRALTSDFRAGGYETTVRTSKDLLVRPYLPRFFREGDRAELRVVVSNQGEGPLSGSLDFDVIDPETEASRLADFGLTLEDTEDVPFELEAGGQATLHFEVTAPKDPGEIAIRVLGSARSAGDTAWSDGELRPLPVLPSRLYLSQSRFAVLDRPESRTLRFDDLLADDDPTLDHESLVMTLDGQLLTTVLNALPYLVEYPYSCTEQSLNRFVSTGIVSEVFADHPMVAELAKGLSEERGTQYETWNEDDPNRKLLLEETPWLRQARGGKSEDDAELRKILDPEVAATVRDEALDRVLKSQTASGGFPWWPGGPPSPYMTLYVLDSFSRALEFGVEVPQQPVVHAWQYLADHFRQELAPRMAENAECCLPVAVYLNWMLSNFPEDEQGESWTGGYFTEEDRERLLRYGFKHWRDLAPRLKGYLALTLQREGRGDDAQLVWDSVMDSAKTDEDLGTYWAPEKMAWLWYNDTIETHAFALRVLAELEPDDERRAGLAQWLLVQKKLNHWKSTRATAEVLYSLVHYLKSQNLIGIREAAKVRVGNIEREFVFAGPDAEASDRRQQWVIEGDDVKPSMGEIKVSKETKGFLIASATWHFATDQLPTEAEGDLFHVERKYFRRVLQDDEWTLEPLAEGAQIAVGDQLEVQLDIRAKHAAEYVHLRDPRGAGFEPEDTTSGYRWDALSSNAVGHYREIRDSATNFFFEWLPAGQYVLKYRVRAATAGTFRVGPAQLQSMYAPEFVAYSTGEVLGVVGE